VQRKEKTAKIRGRRKVLIRVREKKISQIFETVFWRGSLLINSFGQNILTD